MCQQKSFDSFKGVIHKLFVYKWSMDGHLMTYKSVCIFIQQYFPLEIFFRSLYEYWESDYFGTLYINWFSKLLLLALLLTEFSKCNEMKYYLTVLPKTDLRALKGIIWLLKLNLRIKRNRHQGSIMMFKVQGREEAVHQQWKPFRKL